MLIRARIMLVLLLSGLQVGHAATRETWTEQALGPALHFVRRPVETSASDARWARFAVQTLRDARYPRLWMALSRSRAAVALLLALSGYPTLAHQELFAQAFAPTETLKPLSPIVVPVQRQFSITPTPPVTAAMWRERLEKAPDARSIALTLYELGLMGNESHWPIVQPYVRHAESMVRVIAYGVAFKLGHPQFVVEGLRHEDQDARSAFTTIWSEAQVRPTPTRNNISGIQRIIEDNAIPSVYRTMSAESIQRILRGLTPEGAADQLGLTGTARALYLNYGWTFYGADEPALKSIAADLDDLSVLMARSRLKTVVFVDPEFLQAQRAQAQNASGLIFLMKRNSLASIAPGRTIPAHWLLPHEIGHDIMPQQLRPALVDQLRMSWIMGLQDFIDLGFTRWEEKDIPFEQAYSNLINDWVYAPENLFLLEDARANAAIAEFVTSAAQHFTYDVNGQMRVRLYWPLGVGGWTGGKRYKDVPVTEKDLTYPNLVKLYLDNFNVPKNVPYTAAPGPMDARVSRLLDTLYGPQPGRVFLPYLDLSPVVVRYPIQSSVRGYLQTENARVRALVKDAYPVNEWEAQERRTLQIRLVSGLRSLKLSPALSASWTAIHAGAGRLTANQQILDENLRLSFMEVLKLELPRPDSAEVRAEREWVGRVLEEAGLSEWNALAVQTARKAPLTPEHYALLQQSPSWGKAYRGTSYDEFLKEQDRLAPQTQMLNDALQRWTRTPGYGQRITQMLIKHPHPVIVSDRIPAEFGGVLEPALGILMLSSALFNPEHTPQIREYDMAYFMGHELLHQEFPGSPEVDIHAASLDLIAPLAQFSGREYNRTRFLVEAARKGIDAANAILNFRVQGDDLEKARQETYGLIDPAMRAVQQASQVKFDEIVFDRSQEMNARDLMARNTELVKHGIRPDQASDFGFLFRAKGVLYWAVVADDDRFYAFQDPGDHRHPDPEILFPPAMPKAINTGVQLAMTTILQGAETLTEFRSSLVTLAGAGSLSIDAISRWVAQIAQDRHWTGDTLLRYILKMDPAGHWTLEALQDERQSKQLLGRAA